MSSSSECLVLPGPEPVPDDADQPGDDRVALHLLIQETVAEPGTGHDQAKIYDIIQLRLESPSLCWIF